MSTDFERDFLHYLSVLNEDDFLEEIVMPVNEDPNKLLSSLKKINLVEAGGGLVQNEQDEYLFIRRNDKWDLAKGKLEKGERPESGSIREVEEECGIKVDAITHQLDTTYHFYYLKDKPALKKTYWYKMEAKADQKLVPQQEENITEVIWADKQKIKELMKDTYPLIKDLIIHSIKD